MNTDPIRIEFDSDLGIPVVDYGTRCGQFVGKEVNPLTVALYACKHLGLERTTGPILVPRLRETETQHYVEKATDWLISNQKDCDNFSVWEYRFPWPGLNLRPPWRCGLAEAFGALLLIHVGKVNDGRRHLESLLIDYRKGGVAYIDGSSLWFLEYVCEERPLILNGMLHCLLIMRECGLRLGDAALINAFELAYRTLKHDLAIFDGKFYTFYDSRRNPADEKYHRLHVELLRKIHENTKDPDVLPWILRWASYEKLYPIVEPIIFLKHLVRSGGSLYT